MARWHSCNVLHPGSETRRLWQFNVAGGKFNLQREEAKLPNEPLPSGMVAKDWRTLFQPKLNVAWLPSDKVFLRVIQLPRTDPAEMQSMIDFQLEKLSPLPVTQIVWSYEILKRPGNEMQTVLVVIVSRAVVEEFLGQLEGQGYLADRLEVHLIDQLRATEVKEDGAWIYPGLGTRKSSCLVAWWYDGVLCHLSLLHFAATGERGKLLQEQLTQITWAGELEGWLTSVPRYHVVAEPEVAAEWDLPFQPEEAAPPLPPTELAALTARRAADANGALNLLPREYIVRYRQQFFDRLWMRALGAVILAYVFGAAVYILWVQYADWRYTRVQREVAAQGLAFTNALQIKERVRVLQDQVDLQWAALDSYKAVADHLPAELTLESMSFDSGRRLTLSGTATSPDDRATVLDFMDALRGVMAREQALFKSLDGPRLNILPGNQQLSWSFTADLRRADNL